MSLGRYFKRIVKNFQARYKTLRKPIPTNERQYEHSSTVSNNLPGHILPPSLDHTSTVHTSILSVPSVLRRTVAASLGDMAMRARLSAVDALAAAEIDGRSSEDFIVQGAHGMKIERSRRDGGCVRGRLVAQQADEIADERLAEGPEVVHVVVPHLTIDNGDNTVVHGGDGLARGGPVRIAKARLDASDGLVDASDEVVARASGAGEHAAGVGVDGGGLRDRENVGRDIGLFSGTGDGKVVVHRGRRGRVEMLVVAARRPGRHAAAPIPPGPCSACYAARSPQLIGSRPRIATAMAQALQSCFDAYQAKWTSGLGAVRVRLRANDEARQPVRSCRSVEVDDRPVARTQRRPCTGCRCLHEYRHPRPTVMAATHLRGTMGSSTYCRHGWQAQDRQPEWPHNTERTFYGCYGYIKGYNQPDNWDCGYGEVGVIGRGARSIQMLNHAHGMVAGSSFSRRTASSSGSPPNKRYGENDAGGRAVLRHVGEVSHIAAQHLNVLLPIRLACYEF
ncbi:hypothetical protein PENSPDRAFT_671332 [Peniophora sp. CONT]|nr:hypothetical protein PENSPDRAFT_671332 [Peniophora sp. CONT]